MGLFVAPAFAGPEGSLISKINAERTSRGKPALDVYWDLTDDARAQASRMRAEQRVFHHPNLASVTDDWFALAENVAVGGSIDGIMSAFMSSPGHKANILNSAFDYVGAGVKEDSNGILWVSVIFMDGPDDLLDPPDTTTTTTTTITQPPATTTTTVPPSTTTTQPPSTTTTTMLPPSSTTTTLPPSTTTTTTTTQPPATTTTVPPGSTTTTVPTGGVGDEADADPSATGPSEGNPATALSAGWIVDGREFAVLSSGWFNPDLVRLAGLMAR